MYAFIFCFSSGSRNNKTFKPKKHIPEGTHQADLMKHAAVTLGSGNLRLAVMLPEGEDLNEWVAVNSKFILPDCESKCKPISMSEIWPQGYKTFFMLNSTEHEICSANKFQITNNCKFFLAKQS